MEENLQKLEATHGVPASLLERSAAARAKASGSTTDAVLQAWLGGEVVAAPADAADAPAPAAEGVGGDAGGPAASSAATELTGPALLAAVAEARGMPESLVERSAKARAGATGGSVEAVLQEWAEEEGLTVPADAADVPAPAGEEAGVDTEEGAGSAGPLAATELTGPALLAAVAEARGTPEALIERSAKARASAMGESVEAVLRQWAEEERLAAPADVPPVLRQGNAEDRADDAATPVAPSSSPSTTILSGSALLTAVSEARGMPESLIERSASARARTAGVELDDVLREWAEEEGLDVGTAADAPAVEERGHADEGGADAGVTPAVAVSGGSLLAAVAAARSMPESLVERSAKARAKQQGGTVDEVLAEWAAEEGLDVGAAAGSAPEPSAAASADAGVTPAVAVSGGSLLAAVAAARSMPESLVERSAKARAKQQGGTVDEVLAEWAAEEGLDVGAAAGVVPAEDSPEEVAEISDATASDVPAKAEIPSPPTEVAAEAPEREEPSSPRSRYPAWLAAVLVVIPLLAVLYVVVVPNQPSCGSAGQLAVDPATGEAVGCSGGAYGADAGSNFGVGADIYASACAVCHGANGGGGAGPAMAGGAVLEAFPVDACSSQVEWITLGSSNWPDATYGANNTPVAGGMPGFEGQLTETEIAQVTLYERVEFGGLEVEPAEADCGFGAADGES